MRSLLPLLCLIMLWTKGAGAVDPTMPFMEYLDQDHLVCLKWGFDNLQGTITFKLTVNTTGWVGFGFSPNGGMAGSDIIIGGLGPSGSYFTDRYATGNSMPLVDKQQSYTLLSLNESEGQTIMTFQRSIESCDDQDFHITSQPVKLIYAYGLNDDISYHAARRGTKEVNLLNYMPKTTSSNLKFINVTVDNIAVPQNVTYYHCKVMKFPPLKTKHHIYLVEPVIDHVDVVHHMLLYRCPPVVKVPYDKPCYTGNIGDACFGVVATWAVGGGVFELPEDVGIPFGGEDIDTMYRLEIHYNNPNKIAGLKDSSGLKLYYTDKLRQHDVGTLTTGLNPFGHVEYKIPPKANVFHTYGVCNTTAFSKLVNPVPDLQVFAVFMHTHLAGRKVRVAHYRNGKQIDFVGLDENYNFDMQQVYHLGKTKTIKLGDEIAVECTYSTTSRSKVTKMGLATTDEMCLAFLLYYPSIGINNCVSQPNTAHPLMSTSYPMDTTLTQEEIAGYERLLKTVPQFQFVSEDKSNHSFFPNGIIREMMPTPTRASCRNNNASSRLSSSWIVNAAGIILLLLYTALM